MNVLSIENVSKSYGERILFENVSFGIDEGDKIGLIGVNGTGKSTFLKVLARVEPADHGKVVMGGSVQIEYLPQNPEFDPALPVLAQVFRGYAPVMQVLRDYEETLEQANANSGDPQWQKKLITVSQRMDEANAWQLESEAKAILTRLGITEFTAAVGDLSGGQRKRIALAGALINPADLLILDEPTNHIDNEAVAWLEQYLQKRKGALVMVTHDRYFLDRVATRMIELDKGRLYTYTGNYSKFLELKAQREELEEAGERKRQNLLRKELAWMQRGARARSTKQKARIERFEQMSAAPAPTDDANLEITAGVSRLGRKVIEIEQITKAFGGTAFIRDFSYIVQKNDRVGIIGPNGSGKSTLLHIIAGRLMPDSGTVETGQTVKIGYFCQENTELDDDMRVIDYIKEEAHFLPTGDGGTISAAQMLERFLFPPHVQWMPIGKLSGGEKRRLYLLRILMGAPNVLLLDEPTNDLDIQTLTILEDYLDDFTGAVVAVSHDRYFLDRLVHKIFAFEGHGVIRQYTGGYSDYHEAVGRREPEAGDREKAGREKPAPSPRSKERLLKFTFKEQREYEQIDDVIAGVEDELREVKAAVDAAGSNFELLQKLVRVQQELEQKLDALLERWTYLNELAERMNQQK